MTSSAPAPAAGGSVVFFGTAEFAVPGLCALVEAGERVSLVVTQPDRPRGRGRKLEASPVKHEAERLGLPVFQPENINNPEAVAELSGMDAEFLVVIAYGQLLKPEVLELGRRGTVNLHPSLLPRHRGPSPVAWTILEGDAEAGISSMLLDEEMDAGPVLMQERLPLDPAITRGELEDDLAARGADLLVRTLRGMRSSQVTPVPQESAQITFCHLLTREMRPVDWNRSAEQLRRQVHALAPAPGAVSRVQGRLLKLLRVRPAVAGGEPGTVLEHGMSGPRVACGEGSLELLEVQPEGKRAMPGDAFARGGGLPVGARFEVVWDG